jgi:TolB-like protein
MDSSNNAAEAVIVSAMSPQVVKLGRYKTEEIVKPEQAIESQGGARRLQVGACVLDLVARELRAPDGRLVELRRKALDVLLLLGERAGHVVDKSALIQRVWPGVVVGDDSLTQTIVEIRRAIGDVGRQIVVTVARRGYRLEAGDAPAPVDAAAPAFSIAVLPIGHAAGDVDAARIVATLTAELTARAGADAIGSKVAARETIAAIGAVARDPRAAARRLGVRQVVCGDLHASQSGWTLVLEIIDGTSGARRWSHRFALGRSDAAASLETLASQAARAVLVEMHRSAAESAAAAPPERRSADDLALQGWTSLYDGITAANVSRALDLFAQAVGKDASHLRGLTGLAISHWWLALHDWTPDHETALQQAVEIAARLEQLYPGETLTALASGAAAEIQGRWAQRLSIAERLCERDPGYPSAHFIRGASLLKLGRFDECLNAIAQARRLSVDDFRSGWWYGYEATAHLMAQRPAPAAEAARRAMAANACLPLPGLLLAAALADDGRVDEARAALRERLTRGPECDRGRAEWLLGDGETAYRRERVRIVDCLVSLGLPAS